MPKMKTPEKLKKSKTHPKKIQKKKYQKNNKIKNPQDKIMFTKIKVKNQKETIKKINN